MRLKDPPAVKKHIHSWRLARQQRASDGKWVERRCDDCKAVQHANVAAADIVPDSVLHLADATWHDGALEVTEPGYPHAMHWYP